MLECPSPRLCLVDERAVCECASGLLVRDVPLRLEDAQHRLHRAVMDGPAGFDAGDDLSHGGRGRSQSTCMSRASPSVSVSDRRLAMCNNFNKLKLTFQTLSERGASVNERIKSSSHSPDVVKGA